MRFIKTKPNSVGKVQLGSTPDKCFEPFLLHGTVVLPAMLEEQHKIRILQDTGASQSIILADCLPLF